MVITTARRILLLGGRGSTAAAMPAGAVAMWNMDEYTASPRALIPNAMATRATPTNLLLAPRRLFSNAALNYWTPAAGFTDSGLSAPDGTSDASVLLRAGNFSAGINSQITLAAGDYTIACRAKRNTGTDQLFKMQFFGGGTSTSATKTATASWQWFTHTSTRTAVAHNIYPMISNDGVAGIDVQTMDWMLLPGTVTADADLEAAVAASLQGDLYLHNGAAYAAGEMDVSAAGRAALAQFATSKTLTTCTVMALVSKTAAGGTYQSFLSKAQDYANFAAMIQEDGKTNDYFGTTSLGTSKRQVTLLNQGYHLHTFRYDDAVLTHFIDDCKIDVKAAVTGNATYQDLITGLINAASLYLGGKLAGTMALYDRALTDAEVRTAYAAQKARAALSAITATSARFLFAGGDSITEAAAGYVYNYLPNASPMVQCRNHAVSGAGLTEVITQIDTILAAMPPSPAAGKYIVTLFVGANLPGGSDMQQFLTDYAAQCDRIRAAGAKVAIATILPRISDVGDSFNTRRNTMNPEFRLWTTGGTLVPGIHVDAIIDFAADPNMGPDSAANGTATWDATYYSDGVHPTATGQTLLETIYRPVVNAL